MKAPATQSKAKHNQVSTLFKLIHVNALMVAMFVIVLPPPDGYAGEQTPVITIHAKRYEFVPAEITVAAGKPVKLVFVADDVGHGISVDGLFSDLNILPGKPTAVVITPSKAGDFAGECSRYCGSGHERMKFVVHVVE